MWSPIVLCLLVGLTFASNPGWRNGVEYDYDIRGHNLANLDDISQEQTGILFRATLRLQPIQDKKLRGLIVRPQYAEVQAELPEFWETKISDKEFSWKQLQLSGHSFEVVIKDGIISDLIVSRACPNWEVNVIKGVMSQFQLNTKGKNIIDDPMNTISENGYQNKDAVYLTREETVSGEAETLYLIRPLPKHVSQGRSTEAAYLDEDRDLIEIIKHRNFNNSQKLPSYSYGFGKIMWGKPAGNSMGNFLLRESTSRILLTGNLQQFTIQHSYTCNKVVVSTSLSDTGKGSVISVVNATLKEMKSSNKNIKEVQQAVSVGNLLYSYETSKVSTQQKSMSGNKQTFDYNINNVRNRRSLQYSSEESSDYKQEKPQLREAAKSPLLPYSVGYEDMSIKEKINVAREVQKLAKEVGQFVHDSEKYHHEEVLDKFQTMISLIRVMNFNELQEAARGVYSNRLEGPEYAIWATFRDAVAQSGTGPALLSITDWIINEKLTGKEASQVVSTMTSVVRQPTVEYLKALYKLTTRREVKSQWPLNDTILLGLTDIIRSVYINLKESAYHYPTNSFGLFYVEEGEEFLKQEVFPYLSQELKIAIQNGETHKIHTYIRIIGNTGSHNALRIFEPYLEGKQQVSQFQRVLMILAMSAVVDNFPHTAQSVLFRVYQNPGETTFVRMASVFQLMRTAPPVEMLQVMASYTNVDSDDFVNAAVISSIKHACELEGLEFSKLREAARAAKPLLTTNKSYSLRHGANYLRTYIVDELSKHYKQTTQIFGSDDSISPKGIKYTLRQHQSGMKQIIRHVEVIVSSVDDLLKVAYEQTEQFQKDEQQQKAKSQEQERNSFSSQNIAKLLNLKYHETEQLEAFMLMELGSNYYMYGFDNNTIKGMVEILRKWEEDLKKENNLDMYKLSTSEMAISFPTALGLPFLFTYDVPMLIKVEGKVAAQANPQIYRSGKISMPDRVNIEANLSVTVSSKVQSRLSFIAPFSRQQYIAGIDKHREAYLPLSVQTTMNINNKDIDMVLQLQANKEIPLLRYSSIPYTTKKDVTDLYPVVTYHNTKIIKQNDLQSYENTFGKKATGMEFRLEMEHSRKFLDTLNIGRMITYGPLDALRTLWGVNSIQYSQFNVYFSPKQSTTSKTTIHLSYESNYRSQPDADSASEWILNENAKPAQRREELMKKAAAGIKNVKVVSIDASVDFEGQEKIRYILSGAIAKSNIDPKSRIMVSYKRIGDAQPHELHVVVKSYIPNTNAFDIDYILQNNPMATNEVNIKFGGSKSTLSKIDMQIEHHRSEERKHYIKQLPMYKQCKDEMRAGNKQLPACVNITQDANLLDSVNVKIYHENLDDKVVNAIVSGYKAFKLIALPEIETIQKNKSVNKNELKVQARFHPDLQAVNVTLKIQKEETTVSNIPVYEFTKRALVIHPVFHLSSRMLSYVQNLETYRHFCTIDKTYVNTFSNNSFPAGISKHWTVMLQYLNGHSRKQHKSIQEQLRSQPENYVILVRESLEASNKREVKIVVSTPETDFKVNEINLIPYQSQTKPHVNVNGQQVTVSERESYDIQDGFVQIYYLPNDEVKVEINNAFYVIYDGTRVRVSTTNDKYMNRMVGICGQFNEQENKDLMTPQNCIARKSEDFVKSLEVEGPMGKQIRESFSRHSDNCIRIESPKYVDVITGYDYRQNKQLNKHNGCTFFQTKYEEQSQEEICFTLYPQATCSSHCQPKKELTKKVPVHCMQRSRITTQLKNEIISGGSPDFSEKVQHKTISMTLPDSCSP